MYSYRSSFFFFQAEDGIRDSSVTGVQTCALPISDRVVAPNESQKPKEDDPKIAAVQTSASTESVAAEATATPSSEAIPEGPRSISPSQGTGETPRRAPVTCQNALIPHLTKHNPYP